MGVAHPPPNREPDLMNSATYPPSCPKCNHGSSAVQALTKTTYKALRPPLKQWAYELPWRVHSKLPVGSCKGCLSVGIDLHMVLLLLTDRLFAGKLVSDYDMDWDI